MTHEQEITPPQTLAALIDAGLTFSQTVTAFSARQSDKDKAMIQLARERYHVEGEVEIDDNTILSGSDDDGDYVMAWVWVSDPVPETEDEPAGDGC